MTLDVNQSKPVNQQTPETRSNPLETLKVPGLEVAGTCKTPDGRYLIEVVTPGGRIVNPGCTSPAS